jgi:ATP-binding cassette subfamily B protein
MSDKSIKTKKNEGKLPLRILFSNVFYVMGYALRADRRLIISYLAANTFMRVIGAVYDTLVITYVINIVTAGMPLEAVILPIITAVIISGASSFFGAYSHSWLYAKMIPANGKIQRIFINKAARMDLICYDKPEYYDNFIVAGSQADMMISQCVNVAANLLSGSLEIIACAAVIATINPIMALFPITGFVINIVTRFRIQKLEYAYDMAIKVINRKTDYSKRVFYQPEYAKEIKLSDIDLPLRKQFLHSIEEQNAVGRQYGLKIAILSFINWTLAFSILQYFAVPLYLAYQAIVTRTVKIGEVAGINNATSSIQWRLDQLNYALIDFQKVGLYAHRFRAFMESEEHIENNPGKPDGAQAKGGDIEISHLSFKYDGCDENTLTDINMQIKQGEKIAIVGKNGAGKTTFVKLLMRLYDYGNEQGSIKVGGAEIRNCSTQDYRRGICAVFQDYQLYGATLAENVAMGITNEADYPAIESALNAADFAGKLGTLPQGADTAVTREFEDGGVLFSGGESQKIAIARMFYLQNGLQGSGSANIAILDEPSSALDPKAEYILNENIMAKARDCTVIFISHRLSTTRSADRIYMFERGRITEQGTHDELMAQNGAYAEMFDKQAKHYVEDVVD